MSKTHLELARCLISRHGAGAEATWPRVAAFLARWALEWALADLWLKRFPGVENANFRSQLLCLPLVLSDEDLVADVRGAWHSLSRACHHHHYELAPVAAELEAWISQVERLLETLDTCAIDSKLATGS